MILTYLFVVELLGVVHLPLKVIDLLNLELDLNK